MSHNFKNPREYKKKHLPINLARKAQREERIRNGGIGKNRKKNRKKRLYRKQKQEFERKELDALVSATENELRNILEDDTQLSDIPYDITPEELQGELALAQGGGTTIYIQRDGLSTLTVVIPQEKPTIAQLKRAIEAQARVQQKRELRERYEERAKRRGIIVDDDELQTTSTIDGADNEENKQQQEQQQQRRRVLHKQVNKTTSTVTTPYYEYSKQLHPTGELVCSETYNGHQHRPNVSWRFLWRAYVLYNIDTKSLINDEENGGGRKLLTECGIENAQTLKFYKREKYFGRKRQ